MMITEERKNMAAYLAGVRKIEVLECEAPKPRAGEVLIQIAYVGICGSDAHFFDSCIRKGKPFALPLILGHEASGTVVGLGEGVKTLKIGDRVCIEPQMTCGECEFCRSGHYNMCPDVEFPSVPPYDGMLRTYFRFPAYLCHKLPDNVSLQEGAMIEPLAVGMSAAEKAEICVGETAVILGVGTIGLMTLLACKARGVSRVICVDLFQKRLECAKRFGADVVINAKNTDAVAQVMQLTSGLGAEVVFETAGSPVTAAQSVQYLKRCGRIVFVGNITGKTEMDFMELMWREGTIRTIYRYRNNFAMCLNAVASGAVRLIEMCSAVYTLKDAQTAFQRSLDDRENVIKILIHVSE